MIKNYLLNSNNLVILVYLIHMKSILRVYLTISVSLLNSGKNRFT